MIRSTPFRPPELSRDVIVIVGGYGSGKSEVAVNLAAWMVTLGRPVTIADLDIVNPYFRSREAAERLGELGVKSLIPPGELRQAELPVIIPEIKSSIQAYPGRLILDVGGDDAGATVLRSLGDAFTAGRYDMLLVLNAYRPFTSDLAGSLKMLADIERASGLKFTGLISNSHLIDETTEETILHGLDLAMQVGERTGLPINFLSGQAEVLATVARGRITCPVLPIDRQLLKPWERRRPVSNG